MRKKLFVFCLSILIISGAAQAAAPVAEKPAKTAPPAGQTATAVPVAPATPAVPAEPVLAQGASGDQVVKIQQLLAEAGFYAGSFDGKFGPGTRAAVERLQQRYSLPVNGAVDRSVIDVLQRAKGTPDRYRRVLNMEASAYTCEDPGNGSYTYRGHQLRKGLVAVDPGVIPLGTRLYVEGYGYAIADDTGGYIRGNIIDLAFESRREALIFGRRTVAVYILD